MRTRIQPVLLLLFLAMACSGDRIDGSDSTEGTESDDGEEAGGCAPEETWCGPPLEQCINLQINRGNCGECLYSCHGGSSCVDGDCAPGFGPCALASEELDSCNALCSAAGLICSDACSPSHVGIQYLATNQDAPCEQNEEGIRTVATCDEMFPYLDYGVNCCCDDLP